MAESITPDTVSDSKSRMDQIIQALQEGLECLLAELKPLPGQKFKNYFVELENIKNFLDTLDFIKETMGEERLEESLRNAIRSATKWWNLIPAQVVSKINIPTTARNTIPLFLSKCMEWLGPPIRISKNEMEAWIRIDRDEAFFFDPQNISNCLKNKNIVRGIQEGVLQQIFDDELFDQNICIAKGEMAQSGIDGKIEYTVNLDDLGLTPKDLRNGRVSFKDITLFEYKAAGSVLAKKIPPREGIPGFTVTNKTIQPLPAREAQFPEHPLTQVSEDGSMLLVKEDCCITKKNGQIVIDPTLQVAEDISFKTGDIDSKVTVIVQNNVLTGFRVRSDKDICVQGVVEGAKLEAKGKMTLIGGVQGKEKADIEASGDIAAKLLSQARVSTLGKVVVDNEIVNCQVWSGEQTVVTGRPGRIVGGEIHADADVVADTIGSEAGVKTHIILGERSSQLATLIYEMQEKISEQEEALDKCNQVIEMLMQRKEQAPADSHEIAQALAKATRMVRDIQESLEKLHQENDNLQQQYEESLKTSLTVRARKTILPGVTITIQDTDLVLKKPTGPVTVVKQDNELVCFPFKEWEDL